MKIRKGDTVQVISGTDKGKRGTVEQCSPVSSRLAVGGISVITKHQKPTSQSSPGGRIQRESLISISNVMIVCPKCDKPTRIRTNFLEDRKKVRVCAKCQETIE